MRRVEAELEHGTLVPDTEKFALKSPDRFKEKLAKMISVEPESRLVIMSRGSTTEFAILSYSRTSITRQVSAEPKTP